MTFESRFHKTVFAEFSSLLNQKRLLSGMKISAAQRQCCLHQTVIGCAVSLITDDITGWGLLDFRFTLSYQQRKLFGRGRKLPGVVETADCGFRIPDLKLRLSTMMIERLHAVRSSPVTGDQLSTLVIKPARRDAPFGA